MQTTKKQRRLKRQHWLSFWTGAFSLRALLIPLCVEHNKFGIVGSIYNYHDVRVFGFRIIRLHKD